MLGGGALFIWFEPEKGHSLPEAMYFAWSLVFGEPPEAFPRSPVLQENMADKIRDGFDIHIAMSQSAISAPAFATAAIDRSIINSFVVDDLLVVMKRWVVSAMSAHGAPFSRQDSGPGAERTI